jgi:hypothetical protein
MIGLLYSVHDVHVPIVFKCSACSRNLSAIFAIFYIKLYIFLILNYCPLVHVMNSILLRSTRQYQGLGGTRIRIQYSLFSLERTL